MHDTCAPRLGVGLLAPCRSAPSGALGNPVHLLVFAGPVAQETLAKASIPGVRIELANRGAGGRVSSSAFEALYAESGGLLGWLADRGVFEPERRFRSVSLGAFSAGHGFVERAARELEPAALVAFDGYYTSASLVRKPGYLAAARRAAAGEALALFTTSVTAGPNYPSSDAAVGALLADIPMVARRPPSGVPSGAEALVNGGLVWLRYGDRLSHGEHATRVAPRALETMLAPYLDRRNGSDGALAALAVLAAWWGLS